ncbi:hypothetical protein VTK56DRAFT_9169 [Thermocarpiscus australiensis]
MHGLRSLLQFAFISSPYNLDRPASCQLGAPTARQTRSACFFHVTETGTKSGRQIGSSGQSGRHGSYCVDRIRKRGRFRCRDGGVDTSVRRWSVAVLVGSPNDPAELTPAGRFLSQVDTCALDVVMDESRLRATQTDRI